MADKNIVYLLGAGASANAIPVIEGFTKNMNDCLVQLSKPHQQVPIISGTNILNTNQDEINLNIFKQKFAIDRDWFYNESLKHKSIDTFAKRLFLTKDDNLKRLKALMSLYLTTIQIPQNYDYRYDSFFATMLEEKEGKLKLPDNIKFISWNYDLQFEIALVNYLKQNLINIIHQDWGIWPNCHYYKHMVIEPILIKLNGTAGLYDNILSATISAMLNDIISVIEESSNQLLLLKSYLDLRDKKEFESLIHFAWEDTEINRYATEKAQLLISKADQIVITGYSFPIFNKKKDEFLFQGLQKHKNAQSVKIYVQDPNAEKIVTKLKTTFQILKNLTAPSLSSGLPLKIYPITDCDQFLIPDDLIN